MRIFMRGANCGLFVFLALGAGQAFSQTCPTVPASLNYGYKPDTSTCRFKTLEEAEATLHASPAGSPASGLAFTITPNFFASPNAGASWDYRPNGAVTGSSSVLRGAAAAVSSSYSLFVRDWTSSSASLSDQVTQAQSQFDATYAVHPQYSWTRMGAATSTNNISGPPSQVTGVGTNQGSLIYRPASSTASGWGATVSINATQNAAILSGDEGRDGASVETTQSFIWNVQRTDDITCPAGANVLQGATSSNDACGTPFIKNFISGPGFNQTSGSCGIGDPCYPSNGNNLVVEKVFTYGRIPFELYYNSLRQTRPYSFIDRNWSHSLSKRVITEWFTDNHISGIGADNASPQSTTFVTVQDEQAHQEVFAKITDPNFPLAAGTYAFRSTNTLGNVLIFQPASGNTPHFWELDRADGAIEIYDRTGRLAQILYPDDPRGNLTLTYLGPPLPTVPVYNSSAVPTDEAFWRLGQVTDGTGRYVTFTYSNDQYLWLTDVTADDGTALAHFDYDSAHRLNKLTFADLSFRQYLYNEAANIFGGATPPAGIVGYWLTGTLDEMGRRFSTYKYDDWGRVVANWHGPNAEKVTLSYSSDATDSSATATLASGRQVTYNYLAGAPYRHMASRTDTSGASESFAYYDVANAAAFTRLRQKTDRNGNITKFEYDAAAVHVSARVQAYNTPQQRRVETDWDLTANRVLEERIIPQPNNSTNTVPDAKTTYAYDPATGRQVSVTRANLTDGTIRKTQRTYCSVTDTAATGCVAGYLKLVDGPRSDLIDQTTYAYYTSTDLSGCASGPSGACHHAGDLYSETNALGQASYFLAYDKYGHPTRTKDINGVISDYQYSARGWLTDKIVRVNANGTPAVGDATTHVEYDLSGLVKKVTDPDGVYLSYTYDDAHRLTRITDRANATIDYCPSGAGSPTCLDPLGHRLIEVTKDSSQSQKRKLSRAYDALGRLQQLNNAAGASVVAFGATGYDANGNPLLSTDGRGIKTKNVYDALDRLTQQVRDFNGAAPATSNTATSYEYDSRDNVKKITDPDNLATTYTYDALDNLKALDSPDTGHTSYRYDLAGNRISQTDARNKVTNYSYDALNRPRTRTHPAASTLNVTYTYDVANADCVTGEQAPMGHLTRMQDGSGETRYCYDAHGNLRRKVQVTAGITQTTAYTYTAGDRLASITYPSGASATYGLDTMGRQSSLTWQQSSTSSPVTIVSSATYNPFGPVSVLTFGNGRTLTKTYDQDYEISGVSSSESTGLRLAFVVDTMGNITSASIPLSRVQRSYSYDALERLADVTASMVPFETYTYNKTGDRLSAAFGGGSAQAYSYVPGTHRLLNAGDGNRNYDANGNQTTLPTSTYPLVYDDSNRLSTATVTVAGSATTFSYAYNGAGQRTFKNKSGLTTSFDESSVYDEGGRLLSVRTSDGTSSSRSTTSSTNPTLRELMYFNGVPVAQFTQEPVSLTAGLHYIETDHLGSPRVVFDPSNNGAMWKWEFLDSAFGANVPDEAVSGNGQYLLGLRYPGQYFDAESGLHYNYFRDYDPATGRYVESDPTGLMDGPNTYAYVGSSPLNYRDAWGLARCEYSVSRHTLTCTSNNAFDPNFVGPPDQRNLGPGGVFSGIGGCRNNNSQECADSSHRGPIPPGNYLMNRDTRSCCLDHWRLEPNPPVKWWEYYSGLRRNGFKLHPGGFSLGCITASNNDSQAMHDYDWVHQLLMQEDGNNMLVVVP
ncbi:RHS repeat-associated core domain-containing protein [Dokdonella fugitiva]|jgi:RHS repeat-associated protein|nr:RHS repeat-associated core domain-containing protein [Dokdonella fugitiva]MBA8884592.1 RHS repeat-associated protein [Dokdonella fugitiva]